ncbi:MAG: hypothetical protein NTV23_01315 [Propionibacteriales bacterium]|nr:hypothetical protein [Propionibacteriales bacterium]
MPHLSACAAAAAAAITLTAIGVGTAPANAKDGDQIRRGTCSGSALWKVKVSPEGQRLEFEGEIDSNRVGQTWRWKLVQNGATIATGTRTTAGRSGSFTVARLVVNRAGTDRFVFSAVRPATGQTCRGVIAY